MILCIICGCISVLGGLVAAEFEKKKKKEKQGKGER